MNTPKRKVLLTGVVSATLILVAIHYLRAYDAPTTSRPLSAVASAPKVANQAHTEGLQWLGSLPDSATDRQERSQTFGEEIAALTATRKPEDALTAYGIIEGCEGLRSLFVSDDLPPALLSHKEQCATITAAMRRSMYDYLRLAAYAGTPGAGSPWLRYGPLGDSEALRTRPNDPAVVAWKQRATALVIRDGDKGDINALQDLMNGYAGKTPFFDADPSRALAYSIAYKDIVDLMKLRGMQNQPTDADIEALSSKLSPDQVSWAKTFAAAIVATRAKKLRSSN